MNTSEDKTNGRAEKKRAYVTPVIEEDAANDPKTHHIKITRQYFEDVVFGLKRFELRKNDRDYAVGDIVVLQEYGANGFTGRETRARIVYMLEGYVGLCDGYCIFQIEPISSIAPAGTVVLAGYDLAREESE